MTSSCGHKPVGPRRGPLPDFLASGNPVWLGNGIFWTHGHACIGTHAVGPLQESSIKSLTGRFMLEKRHFWSRNVNYPRFFGLFLDVLGYVLEFLRWTLRKRGARSNLVVGGSLHVIESISFSSPTGFPEPQRPPGDPPGDPPRRF